MSTGYVETPEQELRRLREQNRQWLEESTKLLAELEQLRKENERLRAEREEDQGVIAVWRGRTQRAEAEIERLRAEVLAEREACAKVCEEGLPLGMSHTTVARLCAAAIRTREEINAT